MKINMNSHMFADEMAEFEPTVQCHLDALDSLDFDTEAWDTKAGETVIVGYPAEVPADMRDGWAIICPRHMRKQLRSRNKNFLREVKYWANGGKGSLLAQEAAYWEQREYGELADPYIYPHDNGPFADCVGLPLWTDANHPGVTYAIHDGIEEAFVSAMKAEGACMCHMRGVERGNEVCHVRRGGHNEFVFDHGNNNDAWYGVCEYWVAGSPIEGGE